MASCQGGATRRASGGYESILWRLSFQDETENLGGGSPARHQASDPSVQSRQHATPTFRQGEKVGIRDLPVADERDIIQKFRGRDGNIVLPEDVVRKSHDATQQANGFLRALGVRYRGRIGRHPHKTALRERAGGPTGRLVSPKPSESGVMMDVSRPGERNEQIDVEQVGHPASSRAFWTTSSVMGRAPRETEKTGKPASSASWGRGASPRRARSEITSPRLFPAASDRLRAASSTSSSMLRVVRMKAG